MRILVVEDRESLALQIKNVLESEGYQVEVAFDGRDGLDLAQAEDYDLAILDILLPKMNGLQILTEIRRQCLKLPVLLLTVKNLVEDKVKGLDAGADDYLTKPFAIPELLARVRSLLRRSSEIKTSVLSIGDLQVDTTTHDVRLAGKSINLTAKEYAILEFLLYNKNRVVSRLAIAEHVWGDNFDLFSMTNFVEVHIKNLRKKLEEGGAAQVIHTLRGVGYMIREKA